MSQKTETALQIRELTTSITYHHEFSKKKAKVAGVQLAKNLINSGEFDLPKITGNIIRLKEVLTAVETELKQSDAIFKTADGKESHNGVQFSIMNTGDRLDYESDPVYKKLKDQLKDREEKLKAAHKSFQKGGDRIYTEGYDEETGDLVTYEVPVVPIKTVGKQTVKIEY